MDRKTSAEIFPKKEESIRFISKEDSFLPPWLFQNKDLTDVFESADAIKKEALINTLNHIHFIDGYVLVHLRHPKYNESILVKANPEPCLDTKLICNWSEEKLSGFDLPNYQFLHLLIDDGKSMILVPAELQEMDKNRFVVKLPQTSYAVGQRQARRYPCHEVDAELIQNGFLARGELLDFSSAGFRIRVKPDTSCSFQWFNSNELVTIHLRDDKQIFFSGACECIRQRDEIQERDIVLSPFGGRINRFKKRKIRSPRQQLLPSPTLIFDHPLLRKEIQLEVEDISASGFSVLEKADEGVLIPGMIVRDLTISFPGAFAIKCNAQMIYRIREDEKNFRIGVAVLDMAISAYSRLTNILTNALDPHFHTSEDVDMDDLWEFFFKSGFIYPMKYRLIQPYRENFKETYRKLYNESSEIARYFTYQRNGRIYGHIAVVRTYGRAWLIQHHSSRAMDNKRAGFLVLKQIMHYLNDIYRLPSAKMHYAMTYFQPENKIPGRIFGGFTKVLENTLGSSLDLFSYLTYTKLPLGTRLPDGWSMKVSSPSDLWELNRFYSHHSGGLLLDALGLGQEVAVDESLEETYSRFGYLREIKAYSLIHDGKLNAVLIAEKSDIGLNLSDLLNGIKVLVTEPDKLPWQVLSTAISQLTSDYQMDRVPILFYPFEYVQAEDVPYEKQYLLWILNVRYADEYMEYMQRKFRINLKSTLTKPINKNLP